MRSNKRSGEAKVIDSFKRALGITSIDDDLASCNIGNYIVCSIDTLVQSTDVPRTMSLRDAARKAIVSALSDFAAKGAKPKGALLSVTLPTSISTIQLRQISAGVASACDEFNLQILGGDTNQGAEISLSVCAFTKKPKSMPRRGGSRVGDLIVTTGRFGYAPAGLYIATSKRALGPTKFIAVASKAFMKPTIPLEFCSQSSGLFTSSMDSSDGLGITLNSMAKSSNRRFELDELPIGDGVSEFAARNRLDLMDLVLYGGEEYETVFTCRPESWKLLKTRARRLGVDITKCGHVTRGLGVYANHKGKRFIVRNRGYQHL